MRHLATVFILAGLTACRPALTSDTAEPSSPAKLTLDEKFGCQTNDDCSSTCDSGCVNVGWAEGHKDTCVNIRAWTCTCVDNTCYTDGKPPR